MEPKSAFDRGFESRWCTFLFLFFLRRFFSRFAARWPTLAGLVPICPRGHFSRFGVKVPHFSNKDPRVQMMEEETGVLEERRERFEREAKEPIPEPVLFDLQHHRCGSCCSSSLCFSSRSYRWITLAVHYAAEREGRAGHTAWSLE